MHIDWGQFDFNGKRMVLVLLTTCQNRLALTLDASEDFPLVARPNGLFEGLWAMYPHEPMAEPQWGFPVKCN